MAARYGQEATIPRNGAGVFSPPAGTLATTQTQIESAKYNAFVNDLTNDANAPRPAAAGGTGVSSLPAAWTALASAAPSTGAGPVPSGCILMWSGAIGAIPAGWRLCDGTGGTPNLRDRFIVGAGTTYAVGATGGANTVTLTVSQMPSHDHGGSTNVAGSHAHTFTDDAIVSNGSFGNTGAAPYPAGVTVKATNAAGDHAHTISAQGGSQAHENRPPYYALCYIMKL